MQLLNELVELAKKATPGEWWIDSHGMAMVAHDDENTMIVFVTDGEQMVNPAIRHEGTGNLSHWRNDNDATFIAAANPAAILAIAEYVKGLESRIADAGKVMGWKRVEDELPEDDTLCLGSDDMGVIWTMHFEDGVFTPDTGGGCAIINHWTHLPASPEAPHD